VSRSEPSSPDTGPVADPRAVPRAVIVLAFLVLASLCPSPVLGCSSSTPSPSTSNARKALHAQWLTFLHDAIAHYAAGAGTDGRMSIVLKLVRDLRANLERLRSEPDLSESDRAYLESARTEVRKFLDLVGENPSAGRRHLGTLWTILQAVRRLATSVGQ